jgi:outer membrane lipoprotein SlyB
MSNKVDNIEKVVTPILGAVTGGAIAWGEEIALTIIVTAIGAITAAIVGHFTKKLLEKSEK